jgi:hypothetical protein
MNLRIPAIVFFGLGLVFLLFSRQVAGVFRWLNKAVWDEEARRRFPHLAPVGDPPRSAAVVLGVSWIVCAVVFWFLSQR